MDGIDTPPNAEDFDTDSTPEEPVAAEKPIPLPEPVEFVTPEEQVNDEVRLAFSHLPDEDWTSPITRRSKKGKMRRKVRNKGRGSPKSEWVSWPAPMVDSE